MIRINFTITFEDRPRWLARLFTCRHEVASVEENAYSKYGTHTSYMMCLKCRRTTGDISRNCKHKEDSFGKCVYCLDRLTKHNCKHKDWYREPDTDDYYCSDCGIWKDDKY